ncbi:TetR family transcriptional regulator [Dyella sp.]
MSIARKGFAATSVEDIAAQAGLYPRCVLLELQ